MKLVFTGPKQVANAQGISANIVTSHHFPDSAEKAKHKEKKKQEQAESCSFPHYCDHGRLF
jgi:hypothetical protein